jgi:hypothetical protein
MQSAVLRQWWHRNRRGLGFGLLAGVLWSFLTAGSATPRYPLVYDMDQGLVYQYQAEASPNIFPADQFMADFNLTLIQLTLIFLILCALGGWGTWQLTRLRPRGAEQLPWREGADWYLIGLAIGGLACILLFRQLGLAVWFRGASPTPARVIITVIEILLPLYAGAALFFVWLLRLSSIRAPDWETHYPKPVKRPSNAFRWNWSRRKGGDPPNQ